MFRNFRLALMSAAGIAAATAASAAQGSENDALAIAGAKVSLTQAVETAEKHTSGKAIRAEFENSSKGAVYEVEVVSGKKVLDVKIDASNGNVISSAEDKVDREHECDDDDDDK
jgi:uncharacterized membrane protein YkoI